MEPLGESCRGTVVPWDTLGPLLVMEMQPTEKLTSRRRNQKGESTCRGIPRGKAGAVPAIAICQMTSAVKEKQVQEKSVVPLIAI